jgi:hypothetical protein
VGTAPAPTRHGARWDASEPGPAADLGVGDEGSREPSGDRRHVGRLTAGEQVARMDQEPGLAWLERQAEVAADLIAERRAAARHD